MRFFKSVKRSIHPFVEPVKSFVFSNREGQVFPGVVVINESPVARFVAASERGYRVSCPWTFPASALLAVPTLEEAVAVARPALAEVLGHTRAHIRSGGEGAAGGVEVRICAGHPLIDPCWVLHGA